MDIKSSGICRANGFIYEKLLLTNSESNTSHLRIIRNANPSNNYPCAIFPFQEKLLEEYSQTYIAMCPISSDIKNACYTLGEFDDNGSLIDSHIHTIDFKTAKWESRKNYRFHKKLCHDIRCYEEKHSSQDFIKITIDTALSTPTHIILRISAISAKQGSDLVLQILDQNLLPINDYFISGSRSYSDSYNSYGQNYKTTFSARVPWDQRFFVIQVWSSSEPEIMSTVFLKHEDLTHLLENSDRTFMHAGIDPYYEEWFKNHRVTFRELAAQRATTLPIEPLFSIVVPLFKTPENYFYDMLMSVKNQSYQKWELILVNASPEDVSLCELVKNACAGDTRIHSITLESNLGISLNTNAGIEVSQGDFIAFFDHDDIMEPNLLFEYAQAISMHPNIEVLYCDEDKLTEDGRLISPYFKSDFNLDLLRCNNYICHLFTIRKSLLDVLTPNTPEYDGAQDHNLVLQAAEHTNNIWHVPHILYHWRISSTSTAGKNNSKPYAITAGMKAVREHLKRQNIEAQVSKPRIGYNYVVNYLPPKEEPLVSIVIPTCDHIDMLDRCLESIFTKTIYPNYEIVLVENNSVSPDTFQYYRKLTAEHSDRVRVITWNGKFNFSAIINFGVEASRGEYLLLLNNDTEVITPEWLNRLVGLCAREEVGAVGARLWYPDNTYQHAGVVLAGTDASHYLIDLPKERDNGYFALGDCQHDVSAVTGACLMTKRQAFDEVEGFDEEFQVAYNDVDFCLKIRDLGLLIVYTPEVELYHYESASRGYDEKPEELLRWYGERSRLFYRWSKVFAHGDPYYNPNLRQSIPEACYYSF